MGYLSLIAQLACRMSRQSLISELAFDTITTGLTHGVGPFTSSIMPISRSYFIFSSTGPLRLNGILLKGWATGWTV